MKAGWIVPVEERCGIALYAKKFCGELKNLCAIERIDPSGYVRDRENFMRRIAAQDVIHVQYEPSFFHHANRHFYDDLCAKIKVPLVVTVHEAYRTWPDVFPRENLSGNGVMRTIRQWRYDRRHPLQTAFRRHCGNSFNAARVFVHHDFQKEILVAGGAEEERLIVTRYPVFTSCAHGASLPSRNGCHYGATGFINPHYDYDLLFSALERFSLPWRFTWIGGLRHSEHGGLLAKLGERIRNNKWEDRFIITGWVDDEQHDQLLASLDCFCAFFTERSSSGSIASALGAGLPVIATRLPLTEELSKLHGVVYLTDKDPVSAARAMLRVHDDPHFVASLRENTARYRGIADAGVAAKLLFERYATLIGI